MYTGTENWWQIADLGRVPVAMGRESADTSAGSGCGYFSVTLTLSKLQKTPKNTVSIQFGVPKKITKFSVEKNGTRSLILGGFPWRWSENQRIGVPDRDPIIFR